MNLKYLTRLTLGLLIAGTAFHAQAFDGLILAHESVAVASLDAAALKDIYTGKTMYWAGGQAVVIVVAGDKADAGLEAAAGMNPSAFKTHWQRLAFSGRGQQPKKVDDVAAAVAAVTATKGAITIVPAGTEAAGLKMIEVK